VVKALLSFIPISLPTTRLPGYSTSLEVDRWLKRKLKLPRRGDLRAAGRHGPPVLPLARGAERLARMSNSTYGCSREELKRTEYREEQIMPAAVTRQTTRAAPPCIAPARTGQHEACTQVPDVPGALAPSHPSPRTAELVERVDSGHRFLRAFRNGQYVWQPAIGSLAAITDTGTWRSSGEQQHAYWYNIGLYRQRAGRYYPAGTSRPVVQAA
jgi:hypothetical protein